MKTLHKYILEAVEQYRLNEVVATYNVQPNEIILQAPETFSESDIQIYIGDLWLDKLPSGIDYSEKFFGTNSTNIYDVYFKYNSFEHIDVEPKNYIEWDPKYDSKNTNDDVKLDYFKITNLKYIIEFDRFDLIDTEEYQVDQNLKKIFKATSSNAINKYPIEIQFDEYSLKYRK